MRRLCPLVGALFASLSLALSSPAAASRSVEYVTVDANEGTSAGGHAAIRLDDRIYHFQHVDGGYLRLFRENTEHFFRHYRNRENRRIHRSRVDVSDDSYRRLASRFDRFYLLQHQQFDLLDAAVADRRLFESLARAERAEYTGIDEGRDRIPIPGLGYFSTDSGAERESQHRTRPPRSPALVELQMRVLTAHGADFVEQQRALLQSALAQLIPDASNAPTTLSERASFLAEYTVSQRWVDLTAGLLVLDVLQAAPTLRAGSTFAPQSEAFRLTPGERRRLRGFARSLAAELTDLAASGRPDWAWPLAVGMARLVAVEKSLASDHWVVLDTFPGDAEIHGVDRFGKGRRIARGRLAESQSELQAARDSALAAGRIDERHYAAVEAAVNRTLEWQRGADEGRDVRLGPLRVPARPAYASIGRVPQASSPELARGLAGARSRENELKAELRRLYGYNLVTRNCVSEIFRNVDIAFELEGATPPRGAENALRARFESRKRLGGHVSAHGSLAFIPWASRRAVNEAWRVSETSEMASYRATRLAEIYRRENRLLAWLRESNTLSSTLYERNPDDSFFVFFTDGAAALRPIFGAINLVAGLAEGALGLLRLPADGGRMLRSGARGALVSVPELFFVNIRKGSYAFEPEFVGASPAMTAMSPP